MVFSSLSFLYFFFPAALAAHWLLPKKCRNAVLLLFSLLFYYVGEQKLVVLILFSTLTDYFCSLGIERFREKRALTRFFLILSLTVNLSLLGYFKYADLFLSAFRSLTGIGVPLLRVALPIGISFYTFQTMSYTIDVYRGRISAERNLLDFAAYVTLFPQLVAGPIVRYDTVAEQLHDRRITFEGFAHGASRFCIGLGKKVIIANTLAELVKLYDDAPSHTVLLAWAAAIAVPLQIYFDFSGYSDMAIGMGELLGFHFPENFRYPLISRSATEFWRRWHITLGAWFRDYLYIPLGGNRTGAARHIFNLLVVWFATGLWHGASYQFILWGLYYGILLIAEKYLWGRALERVKPLAHLYFVLLTVVGFVIFHCEEVSLIPARLGELVGIGTVGLTTTVSSFYVLSFLPILIIAAVLATPLGAWIGAKLSASRLAPAVLCLQYAGCLALLLLSTAYLIDGSYNPFLYFRF